MILLLFLLLVGFVAPFGYAAHEAGVDASKIAEDEHHGRDSLKEDFHRQNLAERAMVAAFITILLTYLLWKFCGFSGWFGLPYLLFFGAAFGFTFTYSLNRARKKDAWYVSYDPRAALTDRLLVRVAPVFHTTPEVLQRIVYTGFLIAGFGLFGVAVWINRG